MPKFRVTGDINTAYVIEVEAKDAQDARDLVGQFSRGDMDSTTDETYVETVTPLDEAGNEIEEVK